MRIQGRDPGERAMAEITFVRGAVETTFGRFKGLLHWGLRAVRSGEESRRVRDDVVAVHPDGVPVHHLPSDPPYAGARFGVKDERRGVDECAIALRRGANVVPWLVCGRHEMLIEICL
jgi:hypothetical protein